MRKKIEKEKGKKGGKKGGTTRIRREGRGFLKRNGTEIVMFGEKGRERGDIYVFWVRELYFFSVDVIMITALPLPLLHLLPR